MSSYRIAPIFVIRSAGVAFDLLERVATPGAANVARKILEARRRVDQSRAAAERLIGSPECGFSGEESRAYRRVLRSGMTDQGQENALPSQIAAFVSAAEELRRLDDTLGEILELELANARRALIDAARTALPPYLVFAGGEFPERIDFRSEGDALPARNSRARERERHLLLYLQRVAAKNDTFSRFGPSAWGTIEDAEKALQIEIAPEITRRDVFLERWIAAGFAAAINEDPAAREQIAPRLHPDGRIEGDRFFFTGSGQSVSLGTAELRLLQSCDGRTAASDLGDQEMLRQLAERGMLLWEMETPAMEPYAFKVLIGDIEEWRDGAARETWLARAREIEQMASCFAGADDLPARSAMMSEARAAMERLGAQQTGRRSLYSATNPIAEETAREGRFVLSESMANDLAADIEPWVDLWRDTYAFVASRVTAGLRGLLESAPGWDGKALPLPAYMQHCAANKLPLTGPGIVALAHIAFQELKAAFRDAMGERADAPEIELTAEDCAFVRERFSFTPFDEYTYPSADLQIAAGSLEAVERGEFQWVVSELHPPVAMLHHAFYWSCPQPERLREALAGTTGARCSMHFGFFPADFTAHTTVRIFDALPDLTWFVAPQRPPDGCRSVAPGDAEVYVEEETGDVCVRQRSGGERLGSFARAWLIPLGFHPFHFGRAPHMARLRCGRAIVQRRSWTIGSSELGPANFSGVSRELVLAVENLRTARDLPRYVYMRPTEQALRRSGAEGRDKDTKPVYIDLESYLSLEILARWLSKAGEVEMTEMLPAPAELFWREPDGRRTFELRTLVVPRG